MCIPLDLSQLLHVTQASTLRLTHISDLIEKYYSGNPSTDVEEQLNLLKNETLFKTLVADALRELKILEGNLRNDIKDIFINKGVVVRDEQIQPIVDVIFGRTNKFPHATRPISSAMLIKSSGAALDRLISCWSNLSNPQNLSHLLTSLRFLLSADRELHKRLLNSWEIHLRPSEMEHVLTQWSIISLKYIDSKKFPEHTNLSIKYLKYRAQKFSRGLNDPDDPIWTKNQKFASRSDKEPLKTEAEGLFDEVLAHACKALANLGEDDLLEKRFIRDDNLTYLPRAYSLKLISRISSYLKRQGLPPAARKELKELKTRLQQGIESPETLEQAIEEIEALKIRWLSINDDERDSFTAEGIEAEMSKRIKYRDFNPEVIVEYIDTMNLLEMAIRDYNTDQFAPQARKQKEVGQFLLSKIPTGEIFRYVRESNTRSLPRFSLDAKAISDDSGINLRTVERFIDGLISFCQARYQPHEIFS